MKMPCAKTAYAASTMATVTSETPIHGSLSEMPGRMRSTAAERADEDRCQRRLQLALPGDIVAGRPQGAQDPVVGRREDHHAGADPGPAEDLARDARQLEVRRRDRELLVAGRRPRRRPWQSMTRYVPNRATCWIGERRPSTLRARAMCRVAAGSRKAATSSMALSAGRTPGVVGQPLDDDRDRPDRPADAVRKPKMRARLPPGAGRARSVPARWPGWR